MIVNIMKAVVLNLKALVSQTTQRRKIYTAMKLLREHLTLTQAKQMKGNYIPKYNRFWDSYHVRK